MALKSFKWHTYIKEIQANAPVLYQILLVSTKTRRPRINWRLNKVELTVSHYTTTRLVKRMGNDFDALVKKWHDSFIPSLTISLQEVKTNYMNIATILEKWFPLQGERGRSS